MSTFYLQWLPFPECTTTDGMPIHKRGYIVVKSYSRLCYPTEKGDCEATAISPECVHARETDALVVAMIHELQTIRDQARRFFIAQEPDRRKRAEGVSDVESK